MNDGKLLSGQSLYPEQTLVSPGGHGHLHYQNDSNLVGYKDGVPIWASHTEGYSPGRCHMDPNGNFVLYDGTGTPIASTRTHGHPGAMVQIQDDANFTVYEDPNGPHAGTPIWASASNPFVIGECVVSPPPVLLPPLSGDVTLVNEGRGGIRDASGVRLAVPIHTGDFLARVINDPNGRLYVSQQHLYFQANGIHAERVWFFLPTDWWATPPRPGRAHPDDPRWVPAVQWLLSDMKAHGLYLQADGGDLFQFSQVDRLRYAERWGQLVKASEVGVFSAGMGNEGWKNGESSEADPASVQRMTDVLHAFEKGLGRRVGLSTLTSVRDEGRLNDYVRGTSAPTVISYHGVRGPAPKHSTEYAWTAAYADMANETEPKMREYLLHDEPAGVNSKDGPIGSGPGTHVSSTNPSDMAVWRHLEAYAVYFAAMWIGRQTPTIFLSPGVVSDEPFSAYPHTAHLPKIAALLPPGVQGWKHYHGGPDRPFSPLRILGSDHPVNHVRCDHALNEATGEVVVVVYCEQPGTFTLPVISGFEGVIITPDETLAKSPLTLTAGKTLDISMNYGRILIGRRR